MKYILTRKKIKRIILRINEDGQLQVSAPFRISLSQIESFLEKHKDWILETRNKLRQRKCSENPFQAEYFSGQTLTIFGKTLTLHLQESQLSSIHLSDTKLYIFYQKEEKNQLHPKIQEYLFVMLEIFLKEELKHYSESLRLFPDSFKIKAMKSAWGIYHRRGNYISFNTLLLAQTKEFISYVVVHELCHIRYLNHQKEFWFLVATQIPNYLDIRKSSRN